LNNPNMPCLPKPLKDSGAREKEMFRNLVGAG
jgi:hypothetical protein